MVRLDYITCSGLGRAGTLSISLAHNLEVCDRDKSSGTVQWVACFVPVFVVLSTYDMEEVTLREAELLFVIWMPFVVILRPDDLRCAISQISDWSEILGRLATSSNRTYLLWWLYCYCGLGWN